MMRACVHIVALAAVLAACRANPGFQLRGDGEATRNRIFAEAFSQDEDFFRFYRSMQAYEQSLKSGDTRMVLSPDSRHPTHDYL